MMFICLVTAIWRQSAHCKIILIIRVHILVSVSPYLFSDWSTLSVYSQSSLLIHDILESDDDDKFEDEDDSNGKHKQTNNIILIINWR